MCVHEILMQFFLLTFRVRFACKDYHQAKTHTLHGIMYYAFLIHQITSDRLNPIWSLQFSTADNPFSGTFWMVKCRFRVFNIKWWCILHFNPLRFLQRFHQFSSFILQGIFCLVSFFVLMPMHIKCFSTRCINKIAVFWTHLQCWGKKVKI